MKITTKHASNSLSRLSRFVVLFFPLSCCVNSLRSLISRRLQEKNSTLWTTFSKPAFLVTECLKRREKSFQFSELSRYVWTDTWSNKFLLSFSSAHDWDRDNMERATNWLANLKTELTNGRPAHSQSHLPLCFPANSTLILAWVQIDVLYFLCETTKNDYAIPPSIKSNRPLRFLNPTLISNLMHQFKTYTRQQKRKMPYPKHLKHP